MLSGHRQLVFLMKLSTKIGILVGSVLAFTIIVEVFFILPQIREREINLQEALYKERINPIAKEITGFQDEMRYKLEMLARMPEIRGMNSAQQELILSISSRSSWRFETVDMGIADVSGNIICYRANDQSGVPLTPVLYTGDMSESECLKQCIEMNTTCFSDPFRSASDGPLLITIATPLFNTDDRITGAVFAHASIESVLESIKKFELDEDESLAIVDAAGIVMAYSGPDESSADLPGTNYGGYEPAREAIRGNSGSVKYKRDGEVYIAGYAGIAPAGWGLVLERPLSGVLEKGNILPNFILATTLALFLFTGVMTVLGSRRILKPLDELVSYAARVSRGEYGAELDVKGNDEVASVATAIKSMVKKIVHAKEEEVITLIGSLNEGLMELDKEGRITRMNPALEDMLGVDASRVKGKTFAELEGEGTFENLIMLNRAYLLGEPAAIEYPRKQVLQVRSSGIRRNGNGGGGEIRIVIDITKQKELEQMQSDFIANTTHELRTPLHSIRGFVNLLLNGQVDDRNTQHEFLSIVNNESQHLNNLVDSILNISRIESGKVKYKTGPVEVEMIVRDVAVKMQKIADEKRINIFVNVHGALPTITGDAEKIGQVMRNLISNALKFGHAESDVVIDISEWEGGVRVSVQDEGIGIAEEHIPMLFKKFSQIDSSMTRSQKGTGLGLYITRHFVEGHGGKIWVESTPGKGSVFSFTLRDIPVSTATK